MPPRQPSRAPTAKESGMLAEVIISDPRYRAALNEPYITEIPLVDPDVHQSHQETAHAVLLNMLKQTGVDAPETQRTWEAGRRAVEALLSRQALGTFEHYFLGKDVIPTLPEVTPAVLPEGEYDVVATNSRIVRSGNVIDDPFEFFDTSLGIIDRQKMKGKDKVGPENYATAMKLFSDKYIALERESVESDDTLSLPNVGEVKQLLDEALTGFFNIAQRDAPNAVEMTNVYATIRALPKGLFDPKFTHDLLVHTTQTMDQFTNKVAMVFLGAIPKIDTSHYPLETSSIVNLLLSRSMQFETTRHLRTTIRAIDALALNAQTDAALEKFFALAEGFDQPLDIEGIDEVVDRLSRIATSSTEDVELAVRAKRFAEKCMVRMNRLTKQELASGTLTQAQLEQLKHTYTRVKSNFLSF
jgi:hypothetical protein